MSFQFVYSEWYYFLYFYFNLLDGKNNFDFNNKTNLVENVMNNNNYPTEENSNINNDMTKYTIKSSFIDMSYSNYSFRKGIYL